MRAGELRERVTFKRMTQNAGDGRGNFGESLVDIPGATRISADIAPVRATEVVLAQGVQGLTLFDVVVRWSPELEAITVGDIMVDARRPARAYNVKAPPINPDKRRRRLKIMVELGGANG